MPPDAMISNWPARKHRTGVMTAVPKCASPAVCLLRLPLMNSDSLNKWLTLGANLGVFAGLILVAYEINQSGKQLELAASADAVDNFTQAMETLVQDEDLSRLIYRAEQSFDDLDDFEKWRVSRYLDGYMSMSEQDYLVLSEIGDTGLDAAFEDDMREYMRLLMYRVYWQQSQDRHGTKFQEFVNKILADLNGN